LKKMVHKNSKSSHLCNVIEAIEELRQGKMLIVVDDEDRENEGDLIIAGEKVTESAINFMAKNGRGLICVPMAEEIAKKLELVPMVNEGTDPLGTAFTISVDAAQETTTGISVADRTKTIRALSNPDSKPQDFVRPGHIFPLIAKKGGVLRRAGHTEASVDLAVLAGLRPIGVICEILNDDGTMARMPDLEKFSKLYDLKILTIQDLIAYLRRTKELVSKISEIRLPTRYGEFKMTAYEEILTGEIHLALVYGELKISEPVLVRVHSECLTGDIFHSSRCDCGEQLESSMRLIAKEGSGVILYMRQEGRGIGLKNKLKAYELQEKGLDTVEANQELGFAPDLRDYGIGAQILVKLGLTRIKLITNNPRKIIGLSAYGLTVAERIDIGQFVKKENQRYLETKRDKLGHLIEIMAEKKERK